MPPERAIWQISPGRKERGLWPEFSRNNIIAIGWDALGDLTDYPSMDELEKELGRRWDEGLNSARSCWYFSRSIKKNDIVVAKHGASKEIYGIGKVTEEYKRDERRELFKNVIGVHWYVKFDDTVEVDVSRDFVQWTVHSLSEERYLQLKTSILRDYPDEENNFRMMETQGGERLAHGVPTETINEMNRRIIAHLITGRNIIFYGPPGTGKTRKAVEIAKRFCGKTAGRFSFETANAEWTAYDVVGGPMFSGKTTMKIKPGFLTLAAKKCSESLKVSGVPYWLIIDEINRANLDLAFGKVFSLLDVEYRDQSIFDESELVEMENADQYRDATVPADFRVLATMNTYDTALLFSLGYAFRRRFAFVEVQSPFLEKAAEGKYELNEREWGRLELSSKNQVEEIMDEIDDWLFGKVYLQLSQTLKENLSLLRNFDLAETLRTINKNVKDGKLDPFNPYTLACKLSEEITQKGIVEAGYAQAVDVIKYSLIYTALFPESDERENMVRALDEAVKAYFVPHIEYYLPRARRKMTIGEKEEEEEAIKKLKDFESFVEKLGLIRSQRKIQEIVSRLEMGETRIF